MTAHTEHAASAFPWNEVGYRTFLAIDTNHSGYTLSTYSAHLMIERQKDGLQVRLVVFSEPGKRSVDEVLPFTAEEIRTACHLPRNGDTTDSAFAESVEADVAVPEKFARRGNRLTVFCKTADNVIRKYYFFLHTWPQALLAHYMDHHFQSEAVA
jgi:hypothetical protein